MTNKQPDFLKIKNFIDGEWVDESDTDYEPLYNPSTGEQIGEVPISSKETSATAVESSYDAYDAWRQMPVYPNGSVIFFI